MVQQRQCMVICGIVVMVLFVYALFQSPLSWVPAKDNLINVLMQLSNLNTSLWSAPTSTNTMTNGSEPVFIPNPRPQPKPTQPKVILWDPVLYWIKIPEGQEMFSRCDVTSCVFVTSRGKAASLGTPAAVLISGDHMGDNPPMEKADGQVWVYITYESPVTLAEFNKAKWVKPSWRGKIDLTMVYRHDSDFPIPYAVTERTDKVVPRNYTQVLAKKRKLSAQVSSRHCSCQSKRGEYIRLMKKHTSVDVFGRCGSGRCDADKCFDVINEQYKFYLAFENSLCSDYVTEKFFRTIQWDVVPVVRGNADYTRFFPKESYIDTRDFRSPKALADFLSYLDRNDTAYVQFLKAREGYQLKREGSFQDAYCKLCRYLHSPAPRNRSSFDFAKWWGVDTSCVQPTDLVDE